MLAFVYLYIDSCIDYRILKKFTGTSDRFYKSEAEITSVAIGFARQTTGGAMSNVIIIVASVITLAFSAAEANILTGQCSSHSLETRMALLENTVLQLIDNDSHPATCEQLEIRRCEAVQTGSDYTTLDATGPGSWAEAGFCRVVSRENTLNLDKYVYTVELYNLAHRDGPDHGYLGVAFNVIDADYFDFVYFRISHVGTGRCLQYGYVMSGQLSVTTEAPCDASSVRGVTWFNVKVEAEAGTATIYIDDVMINTVNTNFPARSQTGVIVLNGFLDVMRFRNAEVHAPVAPSVEG